MKLRLHHEGRTHWHRAFQPPLPGDLAAFVLRFVAWAVVVGVLVLTSWD